MTVSMTMTGCTRDATRPGLRDWRRGPGLLLAVLLLTGCPGTVIPPDAGPLRSAAPPSARVAAREAPRPAVKQAAKTIAAPASTAPAGAALAPSAPPGAALAAAAFEPDALVGLDQGQTRRLLGAPAATEEEAPARVWRYADEACTLKVFFYMDVTSQDFRALSYDMKSSDNVRDADDRCFARILAQAWDDARDAR